MAGPLGCPSSRLVRALATLVALARALATLVVLARPLAGLIPVGPVLVALALAGAACSDPAPPGPCADGVDNDGDGAIDDGDPGCPFNAGAAETPDPTQCTDGIDNDGDALVDGEDYGCGPAPDDDEVDPLGPCNDGADNDGDGKIDHPADPGCATPVDGDESNPPACMNGDDDDGDGDLDFPADAGCLDAADDDETDPDPLPVCADGLDNDADGLVDHPADPGCAAAADEDEFNTITGPCGPDVEITDITVTGEATGAQSTMRPSRLSSPTCGGFGGEFVFHYTVTGTAKGLLVSTDHPETTLDTVLYVRSSCLDPATELGCDADSGSAAVGRASLLSLPSAPPGTYAIVVDTAGPGSLGTFRLTVEETASLGAACDPAAPDCAPGLVCRPATAGASPTCEHPVCSDGVDNDGDGKGDHPLDPGCADPADADEADPVPLPACGNGLDDDGDGLVDYPADTGCVAAADGTELDECVPGLPIEEHPGGTVSGSTTGGPTLLDAPCAATTSAPERVHVFDNPGHFAELVFSTEGSSFDTVLYLRPGDCALEGPMDLCDDDDGPGLTSLLTVPAPASGPIFVVVDGIGTSGGAYQLSITGTVSAGGPCDPADAAFTCVAGLVCTAGVCSLAECGDGVDNADAEDTLADAADPGCLSIDDNSEADPAVPPVCANGLDDDGDGAIDYPTDPGCSRAADGNEVDCVDSDPLVDVTHSSGSHSGTTAGATHDSAAPECAGGNAPDVVHELRLPGTTVVSLDLCSGTTYDTTLYVKSDCDVPATLACDDDTCGSQSSIDALTLGAGVHYVVVDGYYSTSAGPYTLTITGTILDGEPCDPGQVVPGFLACAPGKACVDKGTGLRCQVP